MASSHIANLQKFSQITSTNLHCDLVKTLTLSVGQQLPISTSTGQRSRLGHQALSAKTRRTAVEHLTKSTSRCKNARMDVFQPKKTIAVFNMCFFSKFQQQWNYWKKAYYWAFWRCISCCFLCICMYFLPISSRWWAPATRAYARINPSTPLQLPLFVDGIYQGWGFTSFRETSWNENEFLIFQYFTNLENLEHRPNANLTLIFPIFCKVTCEGSRDLKVDICPSLLPFLQLVQWMVQLIAILGISSHIVPHKKKTHIVKITSVLSASVQPRIAGFQDIHTNLPRFELVEEVNPTCVSCNLRRWNDTKPTEKQKKINIICF